MTGVRPAQLPNTGSGFISERGVEERAGFDFVSYLTLSDDMLCIFAHSALSPCRSVFTCFALSNISHAVFQRMNVVVKPGLLMLIGGSCSPCVSLSVSAIGVTDTAEKNKEHSAKIFEFLTGELGLTEDR